MQIKWSKKSRSCIGHSTGTRCRAVRHPRHQYRSLVIHEHFKLIYYIDLPHDTLYIADLWDTRREPSRLAEQIKK